MFSFDEYFWVILNFNKKIEVLGGYLGKNLGLMKIRSNVNDKYVFSFLWYFNMIILYYVLFDWLRNYDF